jgi:penicillin-binding protein 2
VTAVSRAKGRRDTATRVCRCGSARLNIKPGRAAGPLDEWAYWFGIGRRTGVDLPGEAAGTLPTPAWRRRHVSAGDNRPWSIGDNESLAVGQGDVRVTPLQLAVAYAALANGGTVVRPHLGVSVKDAHGTAVRTINPAPARRLTLNPSYLETIRRGLHEAAQSPGGTSDDVMGSFPMTVYGKAGSAEIVNRPDDAWYAGFVTHGTSRPIVVVVHVNGDVAAAPVAHQILSQWFYGAPGPYRAGTNSSL